ncbi:MAG TPA: hypothetical protein VLX90_08805 [Steroidobacteraceae bacterium]|nr:hypothetical protein [Steroidobacteraceae bacterium]
MSIELSAAASASMRSRAWTGPAALAAMILAGWALGGCSSVRGLESAPASSVDLSGSWMLNHAASDDPKPLLDKLRPKPGSNRRFGMPPEDSLDDPNQSNVPGGNGPSGGSRGGRRGAQQQMPTDMSYRNDTYQRLQVIKKLTADVARAEQVTIRQSPERFSLDYGSTVRSFTPGEKSVVGADWGVADQSAGWTGHEFLIQIKPQTGIATTERFSISDDGKHLIQQLRMGGGDYPVVELKRVYDHTDKPLPRAVPTSD